MATVQETIDFNVKTKAGRYLHSFVIKGLVGPAVVPEGVHVRFYDCNISTLTLLGRNGIFLEGGICGAITAGTSKLMARGSMFLGEANFTTCDVDIYSSAMLQPWRMKGKSFNRTDDSTFSASEIALDFSGGSQGRITRSTFSAHALSAVKADNASYVLLSNCPSVQAMIATLHAKDRSIIEAVECALVEGLSQNAAKAETSARIEMNNCLMVRGMTQALKGSEKGMFVLNKCETILGVGSNAVLLDSGARADIRSFKLLKGQGGSGVKCTSNNYAYVADGLLFQSDSLDAAELTGNSQIEVVSVTTVKGLGRNAATLSGASKGTFMRCDSLLGIGKDGINLTGKSRVSLSDILTVTGTGGHGVNASGESKVDSFSATEIKGVAGHGVLLVGKSKAILKGSVTIKGLAGHGISLTGESAVLVHAATLVEGTAGDGVSASGDCSVQIARTQSVMGLAGHGVSMAGGGNLHVSDVDLLQGAAGSGVSAEDATVRLLKVLSVQGLAGDGCSLVNPDFEARNCDLIQGVVSGISAEGRGAGKDSVLVNGCAAVIGASVGYSFDNVKAVTRGGIVTAPTALSLKDAHHETTQDVFAGNATGLDSVLNVKESAITGAVDWTNVAVIDQKGNHGSGLTMDGVGMVMAGTTLPANTQTGSGLVGAKANLGLSQLAGGGVMLSGGDSDIQGVGAAVMANAGIPTPTIDFVTATTGNVDVNGVAQVLITAPNVRVNGV